MGGENIRTSLMRNKCTEMASKENLYFFKPEICLAKEDK